MEGEMGDELGKRAENFGWPVGKGAFAYRTCVATRAR
jgi:hypothetical protein